MDYGIEVDLKNGFVTTQFELIADLLKLESTCTLEQYELTLESAYLIAAEELVSRCIEIDNERIMKCRQLLVKHGSREYRLLAYADNLAELVELAELGNLAPAMAVVEACLKHIGKNEHILQCLRRTTFLELKSHLK